MSHSLANSVSITRASAAGWRLIVLGVILWAVGVAAAQWGAPLGMFAVAFSLPLLLGTLPLVWLSVRLVGRVAGSDMHPVQSVALATAPALLLDGVVLTWVPWLYCADDAAQRATGAWLLWFVGASLALAFWRASSATAGASLATTP